MRVRSEGEGGRQNQSTHARTRAHTHQTRRDKHLHLLAGALAKKGLDERPAHANDGGRVDDDHFAKNLGVICIANVRRLTTNKRNRAHVRGGTDRCEGWRVLRFNTHTHTHTHTHARTRARNLRVQRVRQRTCSPP